MNIDETETEAGESRRSRESIHPLPVDPWLEKVSAIAKELRLIRKALEKNGNQASPENAPRDQVRGEDPLPIALDLEGFLKRRRPNGKDPDNGQEHR